MVIGYFHFLSEQKIDLYKSTNKIKELQDLGK